MLHLNLHQRVSLSTRLLSFFSLLSLMHRTILVSSENKRLWADLQRSREGQNVRPGKLCDDPFNLERKWKNSSRLINILINIPAVSKMLYMSDFIQSVLSSDAKTFSTKKWKEHFKLKVMRWSDVSSFRITHLLMSPSGYAFFSLLFSLHWAKRISYEAVFKLQPHASYSPFTLYKRNLTH